MDRNTHRMMLQFINQARCHEDLTVQPPTKVKVDEPRGHRGPDPHDLQERRLGIEERVPLLDAVEAEKLFCAREEASPLYGFGHMRHVADGLKKRQLEHVRSGLVEGVFASELGGLAERLDDRALFGVTPDQLDRAQSAWKTMKESPDE